MHTGLSQVSRILMKPLADEEPEWIRFVEIYKERRERHLEDLVWTRGKRDGGGDIIDLLIRACFIQGIYDERIKTMVKAKGNVNTPMAQLVEVALEEESAIRSERFRKGQTEKYGKTNVPKSRDELREVRSAMVVCYR